MTSRNWFFLLTTLAMTAACGDDDSAAPDDGGTEADAGTETLEDMGTAPWIPDGFPEAFEASSLVFRASAPLLPLAEELRDDSLTIATFDETKTHFDSAIRDRLDSFLFASSCTTFEPAEPGEIGGPMTHADCTPIFGVESLGADVLLTVQPRASGRWSGAGRWRVAGTEWAAQWNMLVGGDCAPDAELCSCTGDYCGTTAREWGAEWEESGSRRWHITGLIELADGTLALHAPGGLQDEPRTFSADIREALVWQAGECLPSAGQLFIIDYADVGINETIDFLPSTPVDGSIRITDIDGVESTVSVFEPCS